MGPLTDVEAPIASAHGDGTYVSWRRREGTQIPPFRIALGAREEAGGFVRLERDIEGIQRAKQPLTGGLEERLLPSPAVEERLHAFSGRHSGQCQVLCR